MRKLFILTLIVLSLIPYIVFGQLKRQDKSVEIKQEITKPFDNQFMELSIFDPSRFSMSHSISMSYFSMGGKGISQSLYLNTMTYQIASPLLLRVQWGIQNFPHNSLSQNNPLFQSGFFISGAELYYKPNNKFEMKFQYNRMPYSMYNNSYYYQNPFRPYRRSIWDDEY